MEEVHNAGESRGLGPELMEMMMSLDRVTSPTERMVEVFRALGDPVRADVMKRVAMNDEVACTSLEKSLTVSKSTISYHMKILYHAGLIDIRKSGRNYFYSARRDAIETVYPGLLGWLSDGGDCGEAPAPTNLKEAPKTAAAGAETGKRSTITRRAS